MLTGAPKNLGVDTFPDPVGHFGLSGLLGVAGIAGGERVPPAPLGWYSSSFFPVAADMLTGSTCSHILPYKQLPTKLLWHKAVHIGAMHILFSSKRKFDSGALVCQFMLYYPRVLSLISPILSCSSLVVAGDGSLKQNA